MIFVTSQEKLDQVFANDIMVVDGEATLFDKIKLELAASEDWLISQIVGDATATGMVADAGIQRACRAINPVLCCASRLRHISPLPYAIQNSCMGYQ